MQVTVPTAESEWKAADADAGVQGSPLRWACLSEMDLEKPILPKLHDSLGI